MRPHSAANSVVATFGMPVYNGENYIRLAIDSILAQDLDDFELVIADNGSTDATEAICREYLDTDERISYHRSPENRGAAWNYTRLVPLARGRYFKWTSHDDMIEPSYLRLVSEELDDSPGTSLAFPFACFIDGAGTRLRVYDDDVAWDIRDGSPARRLSRVLTTLGLCNPIFGMMRTETLRQTRIIGAFDSSDVLLLSELALHGEFHLVREPLFLRRMHDEMSRRALKSPDDVAQWFDTSAKSGAYKLPWTKLWFEHVAAIRRVPMSARQRREAYVALNRDWLWRYTAHEYTQTAKELLRGSSDRYLHWSEPVELGDDEVLSPTGDDEHAASASER